MLQRFIPIAIVLLLLAAGCGGPSTPAPAADATEQTAAEDQSGAEATDEVAQGGLPVPLGDAAAGEEHFNQMRNEVGYACATCHRIDSTETLVGPGLLGVATRAAERVEGQSAEEYIYTSIVEPDAYVVQGFPDTLMPETYDELWTDEQLGDLVAYLLTLEDPGQG